VRARSSSSRIGKTAYQREELSRLRVNRVLCLMINEAIFALQDGVASAADVDEA